ncbi:rhomboid family intramembrane serine protease [Paraburkholderia adhaesiva]|uniref:rhomboid family intramembrane serine protease n=1 Tax=Paraburkholderia adhaesiva TaxID=2883244 RepID=UPI001F15F6CC|nr:rhomboid family intramembrane serine protease [Paraburkholderia adhaesiva]
MSQIESNGEFVDVRPQEEPRRSTDRLILPIALGSRLRKGWGVVRARSFESKGEIRVTDDTVTINTAVARLLRSALRHELTLRCTDIYNVRADGRIVQFDLLNGPGELEPVILRTRNRSDAALLVTALPDQTTHKYATENRERQLFLESIHRRAPHTWATWTIVAIASLVFAVTATQSAQLLRIKPDVLIAAGSNFGPYTQGGQWWRLFTAMFLHLGLWHIVVNMTVLVQCGRLAERLYGSGRFLALYVFAGLTGSQASLLWHPGIHSAGASGAIFGVLGAILAYLVRYSGAVPRVFVLQHSRVTAAFIVYTLINGFTHHGIDNGAHLGGLFGGFLLGLLLAPPTEASRESRLQRAMALGTATIFACGLTVGMTWVLAVLATRPDRQELQQFAKVMRDTNALELRFSSDLKTYSQALARKPLTAEDRAALATMIRATLLPECGKLYGLIAAVQVPYDSPEWKLRANLLAYFGDVSKVLQMTASVADENRLNDAAAKAALWPLVQSVQRDKAALLKLRGNP